MPPHARAGSDRTRAPLRSLSAVFGGRTRRDAGRGLGGDAMCMALVLRFRRDRPTSESRKGESMICIEPCDDVMAGFRASSRPAVRYLGAHTGCSCGSRTAGSRHRRQTSSEERAGRQSARALRAIPARQVATGGESTARVWEGDHGSDPRAAAGGHARALRCESFTQLEECSTWRGAPQNKRMKLTKLSPAPFRGRRCRLMPAPARWTRAPLRSLSAVFGGPRGARAAQPRRSRWQPSELRPLGRADRDGRGSRLHRTAVPFACRRDCSG